MNTFSLTKGLVLGVVISFGVPEVQAEKIVFDEKVSPSTESTESQVSPKPQIKKKRRRVPKRLRGTCDPLSAVDKSQFIFRALVPEQTGLTSRSQPKLYWYISEPVDTDFLLTVKPVANAKKRRRVRALVDDMELSFAVDKGIHALSLAEYGVKLREGVEYEWTLSLVCDVYNLSLNRTVGGGIKYISPAPTLANRIQQTSQSKLPYLYAKNNLWYDAVDLLATQNLNRVMADLLKQVNLDEVARGL
ncbi:DUF928 domain-containing protein [Candidatus Parabeggiatoa sp. HSG14]|uniref:DUF928 domain-containing protein n=1 Tax=Candidatus Parabeggiatoa sp. HSG14 TaxID=3055593 RepID=UPI0025A6C885|nr:DUF928 domain-containing protein [Thiotrichales bacterium HSG14]